MLGQNRWELFSRSSQIVRILYISIIVLDRFFCFYLVEAYGKANLIEPIPAYPELVVSICYTSVNTI
jgi:hypothetical protein